MQALDQTATRAVRLQLFPRADPRRIIRACRARPPEVAPDELIESFRLQRPRGF
jgi:hypothetical protein